MKHFNCLFFLASIALLLNSCGGGTDIAVSKEPQMLKLSAPIVVNTTDSTVIQLGDYFLYPNKIDSFSCATPLTATISSDSLIMVLHPAGTSIPRLSALSPSPPNTFLRIQFPYVNCPVMSDFFS